MVAKRPSFRLSKAVFYTPKDGFLHSKRRSLAKWLFLDVRQIAVLLSKVLINSVLLDVVPGWRCRGEHGLSVYEKGRIAYLSVPCGVWWHVAVVILLVDSSLGLLAQTRFRRVSRAFARVLFL